MKAACTTECLADGRWQVRHSGTTFGTVAIIAATRDEALAKLCDELQYRNELCPCSGVSGDRVELVVAEARS